MSVLNCEKFVSIDNSNPQRCTIIFDGKYFKKQVSGKYDDLLAHILKTLSNGILMSQQKNTQTFDIQVYLNGIKAKELDFGFAKNFVIMVQQLFPDRLNKCFLHHAPGFFRLFFENLSIFIDEETHNKFQFVAKKKTSDSKMKT